ncbi:MAG: sulfotransferase [Kiloniellales bacterium]
MPLPKQHDPCAPTGGEVSASYREALANLNQLGAEQYLGAVASSAATRTIGDAVLCGGILASPKIAREHRVTGIRLLADAFLEASHANVVASTVRMVVKSFGDDSRETDRLEAAFKDRLVELDADRRIVERYVALVHGSDRGKIFGIGMNKTGTTSLLTALQEFGILCGHQPDFELLFDDWAARRFDRIVALARHYEAFQDAPFSLPFTYQALDQAFPDARFVLTVREAEEWYESLVRFHRKVLFGGNDPSWKRIRSARYLYPEYIYESAVAMWRWDEFGLYDRSRAIDLYNLHNDSVMEYFHTRPERLLVIDLADPKSYGTLCQFLGQAPRREAFARENAS